MRLHNIETPLLENESIFLYLQRMKVIGICGQPASGKDTVAGYFMSKGFVHISLGDTLRTEMRSRGLSLDRASMSVFAADLKEKRGMDFLAQLAIGQISGNAVISGIRGTAEVARFRQRYGTDFILLVVEAPLRTRYERARKRNRPGDDISFEQFQMIENHERSAASGAQEVDKVIALADQILDNSGTIESLMTNLKSICD